MNKATIELLQKIVNIASQIDEEAEFYCDEYCSTYFCGKDDAVTKICKLTCEIKALLQPLIDAGGEENERG